MYQWVNYLIFNLYDTQNGVSETAKKMTASVNEYLDKLRENSATNISFSTIIASGDSKGAHLALVTFIYNADTRIVSSDVDCD